MFGHLVLVASQGADFSHAVGLAVAAQAMQQEHIEKTDRLGRNADRFERVEVHAAHFDIFDPALAQRIQRTLSGPDHALWADAAVELVLDLQQAGAELVVIATRVADADRLIRRIRSGQRVLQRCGIAFQAVVADR